MTAQRTARPTVTDQLHDVLTDLGARPHVPSLVVCASAAEADDPVVAFTAGFADHEEERPPTLDTVYGIGSTSKTFAAVSVLRLVADGAVKLHDPVSAVLPRMKELPVFDGVTVHHLLTHTSGLPPLNARFGALDRAAPSAFTGGADDSRLPLIPALPADAPGIGFVDHVGLLEYLGALDIDRLAPPGCLFSYSNEGYVLLAGVVAEVSGTGYEEFCCAQVLDPLRLARTAFIGSERAMALSDVATPYAQTDDGDRPARWWDAPAWAAPGGLMSSARDLLRFAKAVQQSSVPGIPADLLASAVAPHATLGPLGAWYGYGLRGEVAGGRTWLGHAGSRVGTRAEMLWIDGGPCAVALANHSAGPAPVAARAALRALSGDDPSLVLAAPAPGRYLPNSAIDATRIVGEYVSAEGLRLRVDSDPESNALTVSSSPPPLNDLPLYPVSADRYEARVGAGAVALRFLVDGMGPAWGVTFGERVLTRRPMVRRP